jgi:hypothetical protein
MKKPLLLLTIATSVLLFSCKKEESIDNSSGGGGGGGNNGNLLVRTVQKTGSDSSVSTYAYDGSRRLTTFNNSGVESGSPYNSQINLVRNSAGIIQKINVKSNEFAQAGLDSISAKVNYDAATSRYKSMVLSIDFLGLGSLKDSVAFEYDGAGKLVTERNFIDDGTTGGYEQTVKTEYVYNGSNLTTINGYDYDPATNTHTLTTTVNYEFDAKTNPLQLGNETFLLAFFTGDVSTYSANNITKYTINDVTDPSANQNVTTTYTYNSNNRPLTASLVVQPGGGTATNTYTYQ